MKTIEYADFGTMRTAMRLLLMRQGRLVDAGSWQGHSTEGRPSMQTIEVLNPTFRVGMQRPTEAAEKLIPRWVGELNPNLPWADKHFFERVGGVPRNPDPSYDEWPWWKGQDVAKQAGGGQFTHTYSERFWPPRNRVGVRYRLCDLEDLLNLLIKNPHTRQAYLPIFFPEDTGAIHGGRTPCTLGYHFMVRDNQLHLWYHIRSCDYVRHFRDDVYLALRLALWVLQVLRRRDSTWLAVSLGMFHFTAFSMHYHVADSKYVAP